MTSVTVDRLARSVRPGYGMKTPVIVASTASLTLSGTTQTIDGVAVSTGRILAKDQTRSDQNGIYDVGTGSWNRAKDFDGNGDAIWGTLVPVVTGDTYGGQVARLTSTGAGTAGDHNIGTTSETISFKMLTVFASTEPVGSTLIVYDTGFLVAASSSTDRNFRFSSTAITSTATRILTVPEGSFTIMGTTLTQTVSEKTHDTLDGNVFKLKGATITASSSGTGTLTFPSTTDDVVLRQETQTLTNKTLSAGTLTGATPLPGSGVITSTGQLGVGTTAPGQQLHVVRSTGTNVVGRLESSGYEVSLLEFANSAIPSAGVAFGASGARAVIYAGGSVAVSVSSLGAINATGGTLAGMLLTGATSTGGVFFAGQSSGYIISGSSVSGSVLTGNLLTGTTSTGGFFSNMTSSGGSLTSPTINSPTINGPGLLSGLQSSGLLIDSATSTGGTYNFATLVSPTLSGNLASNSTANKIGTSSTGLGAVHFGANNTTPLDDYIEATWTPTDASTAGLTFTGVSAAYTKVGNLVTAWASLSYPVTASTLAAGIAGLPLKVQNTEYGRAPAPVWTNAALASQASIYGQANTTNTQLLTLNGGAAILNSALSTLNLRFTFVYPTSE